MNLLELNAGVLCKGDLEEHPMIEVLGVLFAGRRSGSLSITHGKQETKIYAASGIPVNAETTSPGHTLLDLMIHDNRLSAEDVMQVKQLAADKDTDVVECMGELLGIDEGQLYYYQAKAAQETMISACGFRRGNYSFLESADVLSGVSMYDINPLEVIYEGMTRYHTADLAGRIHALEKQKVRLNPGVKEFFVLPEPLYRHSDVLDVFLNEMQIGKAIIVMQKEMGDINLSINFLYLLLVTGLLVRVAPPPAEEIIEGPGIPARADKPGEDEPPLRERVSRRSDQDDDQSTAYIITRGSKRKAHSVRGPASKKQEARREAPGVSDTEKPGSKAEKRPARDTETSPEKKPGEYKELKKELEQMNQRMENARALYEVLQVAVESSVSEIQKEYVEMSDAVDEQRLRDAPEDVLELAARIKEQLDQAVATLVDPDQRIEYERSLFPYEKERAWNMSMKRNIALKMGKRGEWYLFHNAPDHARVCFEEAINLDPRVPEYFMNMGWAIFRDRPAQVDEAKSYINNALKINPDLEKAHYYLGIMRKRSGDEQLAIESFQRALELDPQDSSARRELHYLVQHMKKASLWERIFGE